MTLDFGHPGDSLTRNFDRLPAKSGAASAEQVRAALQCIVTIKKANKSKGPDKCPGLW
jgi:hypothetical protein